MTRIPIPGVGAHARDRMTERLGRDLNRAEWLEAVASILDGRATLLCVTPHGSEQYLLEIAGVQLRLVWRPHAALIVTVMPAEWSPAPRVRDQRSDRIRPTLDMRAKWVNGRRLPQRTSWVAPEDRG